MPLTDEQKIDVWKRSIETQMHFAELSIKMRQIGLTLAGATIALAIVLYRTDAAYSLSIPLLDYSLPVGTILMLNAVVILFAAKKIDVDVYHRMLRGAVKFNELYEQTLDDDIGWRAGLTETISAYSRFDKPIRLHKRNSSGTHWVGQQKETLAGNRINSFYLICIAALIVAAIALAIVENIN